MASNVKLLVLGQFNILRNGNGNIIAGRNAIDAESVLRHGAELVVDA